jgi:hypothetical protein
MIVLCEQTVKLKYCLRIFLLYFCPLGIVSKRKYLYICIQICIDFLMDHLHLLFYQDAADRERISA